jgi:hypothetical protein
MCRRYATARGMSVSSATALACRSTDASRQPLTHPVWSRVHNVRRHAGATARRSRSFSDSVQNRWGVKRPIPHRIRAECCPKRRHVNETKRCQQTASLPHCLGAPHPLVPGVHHVGARRRPPPRGARRPCGAQARGGRIRESQIALPGGCLLLVPPPPELLLLLLPHAAAPALSPHSCALHRAQRRRGPRAAPETHECRQLSLLQAGLLGTLRKEKVIHHTMLPAPNNVSAVANAASMESVGP